MKIFKFIFVGILLASMTVKAESIVCPGSSRHIELSKQFKKRFEALEEVSKRRYLKDRKKPSVRIQETNKAFDSEDDYYQ